MPVLSVNTKIVSHSVYYDSGIVAFKFTFDALLQPEKNCTASNFRLVNKDNVRTPIFIGVDPAGKLDFVYNGGEEPIEGTMELLLPDSNLLLLNGEIVSTPQTYTFTS
jgi:hypothetical protein